MKTSSIKSRFASVLLIVTVIFTMSFTVAPAAFAADQLDAADQTLIVDAQAPVTVKGYNASYTYNTYISIRDVAAALNGTSRQFNVTYDEKEGMFNLEPGKAYEPVGGENACGDGSSVDLSSAGWDLNINGKFVRYYIYEKGQDFYIKLVDLSLALGLNIEYVSTNQLKIDTAKDFIIDINQLDEDGYFSFLDGTILGNSATGEILYESKADNKTAIASTTKLMTYLLVMEAIDAGKISMNDTVTISKAVEKESKSEDYVIPMTEGQKASMQDLLEGMLVPSSNECALALAEHVAGSEAEFVKLMNQKAIQLGLKTAVFYNPHGLPNYTASAITSKRQNSMSARDMFTLASCVMKKYPKITKITSMDSSYAAHMGAAIKLFGTSVNKDGKIYLEVVPVLVDAKDPLYAVTDVFNGILVVGNMLGASMFYGSGAGKLPTASAVVGDMISAVRFGDEPEKIGWSSEKLEVHPAAELSRKYFARFEGSERAKKEAVAAAFGDVKFVTLEGTDEFAVLTGEMTGGEFDSAAAKVGGLRQKIAARL